jgi:hypothetical protein
MLEACSISPSINPRQHINITELIPAWCGIDIWSGMDLTCAITCSTRRRSASSLACLWALMSTTSDALYSSVHEMPSHTFRCLVCSAHRCDYWSLSESLILLLSMFLLSYTEAPRSVRTPCFLCTGKHVLNHQNMLALQQSKRALICICRLVFGH